MEILEDVDGEIVESFDTLNPLGGKAEIDFGVNFCGGVGGMGFDGVESTELTLGLCE